MMALNFLLPQHGKKQSTKDCIVSILTAEWPLTAKKLFHAIKKRYGKHVTYQAIHKALQELVDQGSMEKTKEGYRISLGWIKQLHRFTEVVESNNYTKQGFSVFDNPSTSKMDGEVHLLTFSNYFDCEKYLYYFQKHHLLKAEKKKPICLAKHHEWRPLLYMRAEYNLFKKLKEQGYKIYMTCEGSHPLDKWSAFFYTSLGCVYKTGAKSPSLTELYIFDDYVVQAYLPEVIKERMDLLLRKTKDVASFPSKDFIENVLSRETKIEVIINKNGKLAEELRKSILRIMS